MSEFVKVATVSELPDEDAAQEYTVGDTMVCIAKVNGQYCALDNVCPHQGGPLGMGFIDGEKLVCPWHGWEFNPKTGRTDTGDDRVTVYELRIEGDDVLVKL